MLTLEARAKINLTLDILGTREDGYHEVKMVMQQIALSDTVRLWKRPGKKGVHLISTVAGVNNPKKNLAYKAAMAVLEKHPVNEGAGIEIIKRIPIAAGLAGGSADAAGAIMGMNQLFELNMSLEEMCGIGAQIGSDVPFCICGGTMLATGRGEVLTKLPEMPKCYVVLAKPKISVSTAWAYQKFDALHRVEHPATDQMLSELAAGNLEGICRQLGNVLEYVTEREYQVISRIKEIMLEAGAMASMMSGSGPTVFALAADKAAAEEIAGQVSRMSDVQVILTKTGLGNDE